jgi:hypothetical protein
MALAANRPVYCSLSRANNPCHHLIRARPSVNGAAPDPVFAVSHRVIRTRRAPYSPAPTACGHGGGWAAGSGQEQPAYNGENLSRRGVPKDRRPHTYTFSAGRRPS